MSQPKGKRLLTDSQVRKIYESRLPEFRKDQDPGLAPFIPWKNIVERTTAEQRAIVYNMKAQYLNHKNR